VRRFARLTLLLLDVMGRWRQMKRAGSGVPPKVLQVMESVTDLTAVFYGEELAAEWQNTVANKPQFIHLLYEGYNGAQWLVLAEDDAATVAEQHASGYEHLDLLKYRVTASWPGYASRVSAEINPPA
jgi:hypothetical protein